MNERRINLEASASKASTTFPYQHTSSTAYLFHSLLLRPPTNRYYISQTASPAHQTPHPPTGFPSPIHNINRPHLHETHAKNAKNTLSKVQVANHGEQNATLVDGIVATDGRAESKDQENAKGGLARTGKCSRSAG